MFAETLTLATLAAAAWAAPPSYQPKPGFVTTDGTKFSVDGKDFFFAGSNAYYLPFGNVHLTTPKMYWPTTLTLRRTKRTSRLACRLRKTLA